MLRLACQEHLIPGETLIEKWEFISSVGYDGIELRGPSGTDFRERLPELRQARQVGVVMPTVCVISDHFIGDFDPAKRRDAIDHMKALLSGIAEAGGYGAITPAAWALHSNRLPPFKAPRSPEDDRKVLVEGLTELGEHAAREGVSVLLEPLNRYEDYMLNTLAQAIDLCNAVGLPSVRVMGDFFHMNIEEADIAASIRAAAGYLRHLHLADSNRLQPGAGHTDFAPALLALRDIDFDGFLALECGMSAEPKEALTGAARYIRSQV